MEQTLVCASSSTGAGRRTLWHLLVEPVVSIQKQEDRRQVRLLSILLLLLISSLSLGAVLSWRLRGNLLTAGALAVGAASLALAYGLSRTRFHRLGAVLAITVHAVIPFATPLLRAENASAHTVESLIWVVVAVLLGKLLLSTRGLLVVILATGLVLLLLGLAGALVGISQSMHIVGFITVVSLLIWVAAWHRDRLEQDRLLEIVDANQELRSLRASLEQRVAARTADLAVTNAALHDQIAASQRAAAALAQRTAELEEMQSARNEREALFRALFEHSPDAVVLIDPYDPNVSWPIIDCNTAACQMNGYSRAELIGQSIDILNTSPGTEAERAAYLVQLRAVGNLKLEVLHRRRDGTIFPIEVSTTLIAVDGRELVLGIDRDITERKQAALDNARLLETERAARQQAETLRAATQALGSSLDLQTVLGIILRQLKEVVPYDSASVQEIRQGVLEVIGGVGFSNWEEIRGATFDLTSDNHPNKEVISTRRPLILNADASNRFSEFHSGVHALTLANVNSWLGAPLLFGEQVIGMITLDKREPDFYTEVHAELALSFATQAAVAIQNARMYTAAQEHAAESATLYRAAAQLLNPATDLAGLAQQIALAVTREFALANCNVLLIDEATAELRLLASEGAMQAGGMPAIPLSGPGLTAAAARTGEIVYAPDVTTDPRCVAGNMQTRSVLVIPLKNQQRVIGVLDLQSAELDAFDERARRIVVAFASQAELALENMRLVADLAQAYRRLQADQEQLLAAEKMASLGRLTAGIAHEMNTPLAAVRSGLVEINHLIAEYQTSIGDPDITLDDHRAIVQDMQKAAQLANTAAERAASFVRSVKSQTRDASSDAHALFRVVPVITDTLLLLGHTLRHSHCTVTFDYDADDLELRGSPGRLAQVITNLMTNAIDASVVKGGGPIQIQLARSANVLDLRVSDAGAGIAPDLLSKIFEPMFTTKPFGQGTGLGLTIVHDIVTGDFGGSIEVASQPANGTTFTIHFPVLQQG